MSYKELRIIGPPGTGKTYDLARRADQAAQHYGSDRVMICSLTRTAAREVAGRDTTIPQGNIGTLHSLAYRALSIQKDTIAETPKNLKLWNEWVTAAGQPFFRRKAEGPDLDEAATEILAGFDLGDKAANLHNINRARCLPSAHPDVVKTTGYAGLWNRFKAECGFVDFTDLLEMALKDTIAAPSDPSVIMADETQDLSELGMRLIRHWAEQAQWLVTVGDPLQCLYHWAGTDPMAFVTPDIEAAGKRVLTHSYRVPRAVHALASGWIAPLRARMEQQFGMSTAYEPKDLDGAVRTCDGSWKEPRLILDMAERLMGDGKRVLVVGACSFMLEPFLSLLRDGGVPFCNPLRPKRGDWNPLAKKQGVSASERILAFLKPYVSYEPGMWSYRDLWRWVEICEAKGLLAHGAKGKIEDASGSEDWREECSGVRLFEWFDPDAIAAAMDAAAATGDPEWLLQHALPTKRKTLEFPARVYRKRGAEALVNDPMLVVGTIHSVKGYDGADAVFLMPDLSASGQAEWEKEGDGKDGIRRMFYVAMTRARETLYLCKPVGSAVKLG